MALSTPAVQATWDAGNVTFAAAQAADVQTVTYAGSSVAAVVEYDANLDDLNTGRKTLALARIWIQTADVALPDYRDTVIIGTTTWRVRRIAAGTADVWELSLYRDERPGPGGRR